MEARDINRREILRYLGARSGQRDEAVERLVEDCIGELFAQTRPRHIVRQFPLTLGADGEIDGDASGPEAGIFIKICGTAARSLCLRLPWGQEPTS